MISRKFTGEDDIKFVAVEGNNIDFSLRIYDGNDTVGFWYYILSKKDAKEATKELTIIRDQVNYLIDMIENRETEEENN